MITENLNILFDPFHKAGFQLRLVGGCVRDHLLGETPKDIDLCTDATPLEMELIAFARGFKFIPTGIEHGTATFVVNNELFEITTLRIDVATDGRHAQVAFTRSFEEDAARRDLTINAMSMDRDGTIYDYFGGEQDLMNRKIRFVGNPIERIQEDYLRILRFFRFAARFGGIKNATDQIDLIITADPNGEGLRSISVERYWLEMQKLLIAPHKDEVIRAMYMSGILQHIGLEAPFQHNTQGDAVAELSNLVRPWTIDAFLNRWKLSSEEASKLRWLVSVQNNPPLLQETVQDLLVDGIPRNWIVSAIKLTPPRVTELFVKFAEQWEIPIFPVRGQDLVYKGVPPGPLVGKLLKTLREEWKDSRFTLTKEQLLS